MKCRNINEKDNSAVFFQTVEAKWPKYITVDVSITFAMINLNIKSSFELNYTNQQDTYQRACQLSFSLLSYHLTVNFNITILGKNRQDAFTEYSKDIYNVLIIDSIEMPIAAITISSYKVSFENSNRETYLYQMFNATENVTEKVVEPVPMSSSRISNYVEDGKAVQTSLTQKLSVMKSELWFAPTFGLPLFDDSSSTLFDAYVAMIVNSQNGVKQITKFSSDKDNHTYNCNFDVETIYGMINVSK